MNDYKVIGEKIFNARKNLKMSRADLGKKVDLHESTVKRYEDGHIKNLDIDKLSEFAKALDISPAYLMGWDTPTPSSHFHTIAANRTDNPMDDLPPEAQERVNEFIELMRIKYGTKK